MKKLLVLIMLLICTGCGAKREDYYVFSFDDYSVSVGYDSAEFARLAFDFDIPETLVANQMVENDIYCFGRHIGTAKFTNPKNKNISGDKAVLTELSLFFDENPNFLYRIDDYVMSDSVRENCEHFNGEYIERNGTACVIGKNIGKKKNVIILQGDMFKTDQDQINRIRITIE